MNPGLRFLSFFGVLLSLCLLQGVAWGAGAFPPDVAGAADHPLIKRFIGSALIGYRTADWDQTVMPTSAPLNNFKLKDKLKDKLTIEGKWTGLIYLSLVASNASETGRAKNRRVELVLP